MINNCVSNIKVVAFQALKYFDLKSIILMIGSSMYQVPRLPGWFKLHKKTQPNPYLQDLVSIFVQTLQNESNRNTSSLGIT